MNKIFLMAVKKLVLKYDEQNNTNCIKLLDKIISLPTQAWCTPKAFASAIIYVDQYTKERPTISKINRVLNQMPCGFCNNQDTVRAVFKLRRVLKIHEQYNFITKEIISNEIKPNIETVSI